MTAFDSDILTDVFGGREPYASRLAAIPIAQRGIPVVVAEELIRGRLDQVRKAEAGRSKLSIPQAYNVFETTLDALRGGVLLPFSDDAQTLVRSWKSAKLGVGTHDLRIAATAIVLGYKLVTRNARDFAKIPNLYYDVWV